MRNGHLILHQNILHSPAWKDGNFWRLWCWCLLQAGRKARVTVLDQIPMRLAAGELAASLAQIYRETDLDPAAVRKSLAVGKELGLFEVCATPWGLRIKIANWQEYFRLAPPMAKPLSPRAPRF